MVEGRVVSGRRVSRQFVVQGARAAVAGVRGVGVEVASGAVGAASGVANRLLEAWPDPMAFRALTVNAYDTPFDKPDTVQPRPDVVQVATPGLAVTG